MTTSASGSGSASARPGTSSGRSSPLCSIAIRCVPAGAKGVVPGPGGWLPQRGPVTPGSHREETKARCDSSLSGGSVGISGFKSLGRGWKDLWFVVPVAVKMGSLPICADLPLMLPHCPG